MDLLDIIDGINGAPKKPSCHDCNDAIAFASNSGVKEFDYRGFTFRVNGNAIIGHGKHGEVLCSSNKGTVVCWEGESIYDIALATVELPHGIEVKDCELNGSVIAVRWLTNTSINGSVDVCEGVLSIKGDVRVQGSIYTHEGDLFIDGLDCDNASLMITDKRGDRITQPLIGPQTHDNMSYGRWSLVSMSRVLLNITLENVAVVISSNASFTIGSYGYQTIPEIHCDDNSYLDCPEKYGYRHLVEAPVAPEGSTKIEGYCRYVISKDKEGKDIPLSTEAQQLVNEIRVLRPDVASKVTAFNPMRNLKAIRELLDLNREINVDLLLEPTTYSNIASVQCCCVLGVPKELYRTTEIMWMVNKCTYILIDAGYTREQIDSMKGYSECIAKIARSKFGTDITKLSEFEKRYIYEMIPEYEFYFSGKSKDECVREFLNA